MRAIPLDVFALLGLALAVVAPWPGALVTVGTLALLVARQFIAAEDSKRAQATIDGMKAVVDNNASKLILALQRIEVLENTRAMGSTMPLGGTSFGR